MFSEFRPSDANTPDEWSRTLRPTAFLRLRLDPRWRLVTANLSAPILDVGCGRGAWVDGLSRYGLDTIGMDYSQELIDSNRALYPTRKFLLGSAQHIPLPDRSFSSVISWGVIEHELAGPSVALQEMRRVLRPGGRALVTVPLDSAEHRLASASQFPEGSYFFQHFFTPDELAGHVQAAGFRVLEIGPAARSHPATIWPRGYAAVSSRFGRRALQLAALLAPARFANMIYCLALRDPALD
jgi:SAM-dependent methyltransferase